MRWVEEKISLGKMHVAEGSNSGKEKAPGFNMCLSMGTLVALHATFFQTQYVCRLPYGLICTETWHVPFSWSCWERSLLPVGFTRKAHRFYSEGWLCNPPRQRARPLSLGIELETQNSKSCLFC